MVFRRIPANPSYYIADAAIPVTQLAFLPNRNRDVTGLSVSRAKYKTAEQAAAGQPGKQYYIAELSVKALRAAGHAVEPKPLPNDPSHAEITTLNAALADNTREETAQFIVDNLILRVTGPY